MASKKLMVSKAVTRVGAEKKTKGTKKLQSRQGTTSDVNSKQVGINNISESNLSIKFEDIPVEWKSTHTLEALIEQSKHIARNQLTTATLHTVTDVLGIQKGEWRSVFKFLNYDTQKDCRLVCAQWNKYISTWQDFAEKTRLVYDGGYKSDGLKLNLSSFFGAPKTNIYWQDFRLQNASPSTSRLWLGRIFPSFATTLELRNCLLNWFDLIEILSLFKSLSYLSIIVDFDAEGGPMKYFSLFIHDLQLNTDDDTKHFSFNYEDSPQFSHVHMDSYSSSLTNLKSLVMDVKFIDFSNAIIKLIALSECAKIEEFRLALNKDVLGDAPPEFPAQHNLQVSCQLDDLLRNTGNTLTKLQVIFGGFSNDERIPSICTVSELTQNCAIHMSALGELFESGNSFVNLKEFELDLGSFSHYGHKYKTLLRANVEKLQAFLASQTNLKKFSLRDVCWSYEPNKKFCTFLNSFAHGSCRPHIGVFVLGGFKKPYIPNWNEFFKYLTSIKIQWESCNTRRLQEILPETTYIMPRVTYFELLNNLPICFVSFDVDIIVSKFPNLVHLHLEDIDQPAGKDVLCSMGHRIIPAQFFDADLQVIFGTLKNLEILYIKTRMYPVTDYAFTGINHVELDRLQESNSFDFNPKEMVGFQLCGLKRLRSLTLIGLSYKVTDATAIIAFRSEFPTLTTLNFVTSGFTKNGIKFLQKKFGDRPGFNLTTSYSKEEEKLIYDKLHSHT